MTTATLSSTTLLRNALRGNSIFSTIAGILMIVASGGIASLIGVASPTVLLVMGIGIVAFALFLFREASRQPLNLNFAQIVFALDALWVVATVIILALDLFGLTTEGRWLLLIIADIVALFAIAEYVGLRRAR